MIEVIQFLGLSNHMESEFHFFIMLIIFNMQFTAETEFISVAE